MTEVDLFVSTKRVKVLTADSQVQGRARPPGWGRPRPPEGAHSPPRPGLPAPLQEAMMDHALQTISYIADIGNVLVLMARRRLARRPAPQAHSRQLYRMICHVFHSEDVSSPAPGVRGGGGGERGTRGPPCALPETPWSRRPCSVLPSVLSAVGCLPHQPLGLWSLP